MTRLLSTSLVFALGLYVTVLLTTNNAYTPKAAIGLSSSCPSACDMNSDGEYTQSDGEAFAQCIFNGCASDTNGDGVIDAGDVSYCIVKCVNSDPEPTATPQPEPTATPQPEPTATTAPVAPTSPPQPTTAPQATSVPQPTTAPDTTAPTTYIPPQATSVPQPTTAKRKTGSTPTTSQNAPLSKKMLDYTKYCDRNNDSQYTKTDGDAISKCIFDGHGHCATVDVNADGIADAGDMSAAVLCASNGQAQENCAGADFNNDGTITQDEVQKISDCIFSGCSLIDPNGDGITDAGDLTSCQIKYNSTEEETFSCATCGSDITFCSKIASDQLQDCIFNPQKAICKKVGQDGKNVWDVNNDGIVDAGDITAYQICSSCNDNCDLTSSTPPTSRTRWVVNYIRSFFGNIFGRFF